jgi:hypothetical protein
MLPTFIVTAVLAAGASAALLLDAVRDRIAAVQAAEPNLVAVANQHIVSEAVRLAMVLMVAAVGVLAAIPGRQTSDLALGWLLLAVPILAAFDGVYAWVWRRAQFDEVR